MTPETIYLVEVDAWDGGAVVTLRWASHGYTTGPAETPTHAYYAPRVQQPALYRLAAWSAPDAPRSRPTAGEIVLANPDGLLDFLADYGLDGRRVRVRVGPDGGPYAAFQTVIDGTLLAPAWEASTVVLRLRDRQELLDRPLRHVLYGGTNSPPAGVDGGADLKDQPKPLLYGRVLNAAPTLVNGAKLIYQIHDGALHALDAVYDRGAALTAGAAYGSQAELEATAPAAGQYRAWLAGGLLRLGSTPAGQLTADATQGATAADRYPGALLAVLAARLDFDDIDTAALAALDTAAPYECGLVIDATETAAGAIDRVCLAAGAWWTIDALGRLTAARLTAPAGAPALELTAADLVELSRTSLGDGPGGLPVWRTTLGYAQLATVQAQDLAGVVSAERRARLAQEYLSVAAADTAVQTVHALAAELRIDTPLALAADAAAEAARRQALHGVRRDRVSATVRLPPAVAAGVAVGQCVRITDRRLGYAAGRLLRVVGIERDAALGRLALELWG